MVSWLRRSTVEKLNNRRRFPDDKAEIVFEQQREQQVDAVLSASCSRVIGVKSAGSGVLVFSAEPRRGHGTVCFTLIELLVVIAIIAILASLLLPALNNARDTARSATCVSRLKQIYLMTEQYRDDNDEWYVAGDVWGEYTLVFATQIYPYLPAGMRTPGYYRTPDNHFLMDPGSYYRMTPQMLSDGSYYWYSLSQTLLYASAPYCYWPSAYFGYGNTQFGAQLPHRILDQAKGPVLLIGEVRDDGNVAGNFGFWSWSMAYYNHGNNTRSNCVFTDGHTQSVRTPFSRAVANGEVLTR